jgi:hypothetical protein
MHDALPTRRRSWTLPVVSAVLSVLACVPACTAHAVPVDRIIATVNEEVVTASDLAHAVALNMRFGAKHDDQLALAAQTLDGLITRRLLVQEARRLRFVEVSDHEAGAELERTRRMFGSDAAYAGFLSEQDMSEQELGRMLAERLIVERFVEKKVRLFVRVGREEAQAYFDGHAADFKGRRFPDVQKSILALLTDRKVGQQLGQYITELRDKADIRMNTGKTVGSMQ